MKLYSDSDGRLSWNGCHCLNDRDDGNGPTRTHVLGSGEAHSTGSVPVILLVMAQEHDDVVDVPLHKRDRHTEAKGDDQKCQGMTDDEHISVVVDDAQVCQRHVHGLISVGKVQELCLLFPLVMAHLENQADVTG